MHTYRYNPVFRCWVLLGEAAEPAGRLEIRQLIRTGTGEHGVFAAATAARQPFVCDPPPKPEHPERFLYAEQPPVGEYEHVAYSGDLAPESWGEAEWQGWLRQVQERLLQFHANPYLHHAAVSFRLDVEPSAGGWIAAGDLIAASHPLAGEPPRLTAELAAKLRSAEKRFFPAGPNLYVPSAPLQEYELWYLPSTAVPGLERAPLADLASFARVLARLLPELAGQYGTAWTLRLHTSLAGADEEGSWWAQLYRTAARQPANLLDIRPLPEALVKHLRVRFGD